jgi:hypothetical protein
VTPTGIPDFQLPGDEALATLGLARAMPRPPTSPERFPDGGAFRIEIPSVEGVEAFRAVLEAARRLEVPIHRISQGSGVMMLTDPELDEMIEMGREQHVEVCLFLGPRGSWDIGVSRLASSGGVGPRARGREQLGQAIADAMRGVAHGLRCLLVADEGVLWSLHRLRAKGELPADLRLKVSVLAGPANPASFQVLAALGADSINVPSDLSMSQLGDLRASGVTAIDFYIEAPDDLGGTIRLYDSPELVRVAAPIYLKFGLRNAPNIYPSGRHLIGTAVAMAEERVRRARLALDVLQDAGLVELASPPGSEHLPASPRFAG